MLWQQLDGSLPGSKRSVMLFAACLALPRSAAEAAAEGRWRLQLQLKIRVAINAAVLLLLGSCNADTASLPS
jgi:hypothetical protein